LEQLHGHSNEEDEER